jgi:hypothetical protein
MINFLYNKNIKITIYYLATVYYFFWDIFYDSIYLLFFFNLENYTIYTPTVQLALVIIEIQTILYIIISIYKEFLSI